MFYIFSFFWFLRAIKQSLFYFYLWQLKEYHIGRFLSHFKTEKGERLLSNKVFWAKILLLTGCWFQYEIASFLVLSLWILESLLFLRKVFMKNWIRPVFTYKMDLLSLIFFTLLIFFGLWVVPSKSVFRLLLFDILTPVIVSILVLFGQPFVLIAKSKIIKRAREKRRMFGKLVVIGITGSYGKSSTKEFLAQILSSRFNVLKTSKNHNSEMGVSQCILNELKPEHQVFVCEMGAYKKGSIKVLTNITQPQIGILSGINQQHQSLFGSQQNIIKTKYELIESLPDKGVAIFNGNNKYCVDLYQRTKKLKRITGYLPEHDLYAKDIEIKKESLSFKIVDSQGKEADFSVNLLGQQNIENILLASQAALEMGMSLDQIALSCENIKAQPRTMELKKGKNEFVVIDDSYNSNPKGVIAALQYLKILPGRKVVIMPCLIELGKNAKKAHQDIGQMIEEVCDLAIITTKEYFEDINGSSSKIFFLDRPANIVEKLKSFLRPGDALLLEGRASSSIISHIYDQFL